MSHQKNSLAIGVLFAVALASPLSADPSASISLLGTTASGAMQSVREIPAEYSKGVAAGMNGMSVGANRMRNGDSVDKVGGLAQWLEGLLAYLSAPLSGPIQAVVGTPVTRVARQGGMSQEHAEIAGAVAGVAAAFAIPVPSGAGAVRAVSGLRDGTRAVASRATLMEARTRTADKIHEAWQRGMRASGRVESFKFVKVDGVYLKASTEAEVDAYRRLTGLPAEFRDRVRIGPSGRIVEDIVTIPRRFLAENQRAEIDTTAGVAIYYIQRQLAGGGKLDNAFLERTSSTLHNAWMERHAGWAPQERMVPYSKLSPAGAEEHRAAVRVAIEQVRNLAFEEYKTSVAAMHELASTSRSVPSAVRQETYEALTAKAREAYQRYTDLL